MKIEKIHPGVIEACFTSDECKLIGKAIEHALQHFPQVNEDQYMALNAIGGQFDIAGIHSAILANLPPNLAPQDH